MAASPLHGLKVLELGELLAGPFVGTLLGEFGAEVIKIERPNGGDVLRQFGPMVGDKSFYWSAVSRNKKSVVLDLKSDKGRGVLIDLIKRCDALINSLRPGTLESWGITETQLKELNPRLVVVQVTAFGRKGENAKKGGYDPIAQGYSGLSALTGQEDGPPMRAGGPIPVCDFMTGLAGAFGALLSLYARDRTDHAQGQTVDIALYDVAFRMVGPLLGYFDATGKVWSRTGNHSLGGAPTGHFMTADGHWVCVSVQNNDHFKRLTELVQIPHWKTGEKYMTPALRTQNRDEICADFADWVRTQTRDEIVEKFDAFGLVVGPINSIADLADDAHLSARGYTWIEEEALGPHRTPDVIPRLSETPGEIRTKAPVLGADTRFVLKNFLDYSDAHCDALFASGALGPQSPHEPRNSTKLPHDTGMERR